MKLSVLGLSVLLSSSAFAASAVSISDASCVLNGDKSHQGYRIGPDSFLSRGKCVNAERYRPVENLQINGDLVSFNNYYYKGRFYKAEFRLNEQSVKDTLFHIKHFPTVKGVDAAHTQIRYRFNTANSIQLTDLITGEKTAANDILISYEAALPKEEKFNFAFGSANNYPFVGRVGEGVSIALEEPRAIQQYVLELSPAEQVQLLKNSLKRSQDIALSTYYNTLRPNCTTEQFDLLDTLPRLKGAAPQFLTVMSNDPVATPSIQALKSRKILKQRIQDFSDEVAGKIQNLAVPETAAQSLPDFLPSAAGKPWSMVVISPKENSLTTAEKQAFSELTSQMVSKTTKLMNAYASAVMLSGSVEQNKMGNIYLAVMQQVQKELQPALAKLDASVSTSGHILGVYLTPMTLPPGVSSYTDLTQYGVKAAIPLPVHKFSYDPNDRKTAEIFYWLAQGSLVAGDVGVKKSIPAYLQMVAAVVNAKPKNSSLTTQVAIGLNAVTKPMSKNNEQVKIRELAIKSSQSRSDRPSALFTYTQYARMPLQTSMQIDFGPLGGMAGTAAEVQGVAQINKGWSMADLNDDQCKIRASAIPQLNGVFGPTPTGSFADLILRDKPVTFQILGGRLNLATQKLDSIDVRVATFPFTCAQSSTVNQEFLKSANQSIQQLKDKLLQQSENLDVLIKQVFN
jgi:hypothetical protein